MFTNTEGGTGTVGGDDVTLRGVETLPQIIVTADRPTDRGEGSVMWRERITPADLESSHFKEQLVQRLGWAVDDASAAEVDSPTDSARPTASQPES
jgi:hypothetical protein